jgi:hypothetical protein
MATGSGASPNPLSKSAETGKCVAFTNHACMRKHLISSQLTISSTHGTG